MLAYLDHAATSPVRPEAAAAMLPWLTERFGNPSGAHRVARAARLAVDDARESLAAGLGVDAGSLIFTSGGTEAANLAILGRLGAAPGAMVTTAVEHPAVLEAAKAARVPLRVVGVDGDGVLDLDQLADALDESVSVVSVQLVNNEVGVIQPLEAAARLVRRRAKRAVLHTDAVQAAPWLDLTEAAAPADLVTVSAHKFGGPQGVGVLGLRRPIELAAMIHGGPQERERRAGTHNVAGIVGAAAALEVTRARLGPEADRVAALRDRLARGLAHDITGLRLTATAVARTPGHCHALIDEVESETLLLLLDEAGICASAGSACASGALEPSPVLAAMGRTKAEAAGALRLSLGHTTTDAEVDLALKVVPEIVAQLRQGEGK